MRLLCDCGKFEAEVLDFPGSSPGRLACYCKDCQSYLNKLVRKDVLDDFGGTEIVPVYPCDLKLVKGMEFLRCNRLSPNGLNRWSTSCCNSPIGNIKAKFPWLGLVHSAIKAGSPEEFDKLGPVRSRIFGKHCKAKPPFPVSEKMSFKDAITVLPFIFKGLLLKKYKGSPLFKADGLTPISEPVLLSRDA